MSYSTHHSVQGSRLTQTVSFSSTACQPAPTWAGASSSGTTWNVWWSKIKIAVFCHILHELIQVATSVTTCNLILCAAQVFHLDASFSCIVDKLFHLNNGITTSVPKRKFGSACWVLGLIITFPFGFWIEFDLDFFIFSEHILLQDLVRHVDLILPVGAIANKIRQRRHQKRKALRVGEMPVEDVLLGVTHAVDQLDKIRE